MTQQLMTLPRTIPERRDRGRPPLVREFLAGLDYFGLKTSPVYRGEGVTRGDGAPVILVPGMFASDVSLGTMYGWLGRIGYTPHYSNIGRNRRCPDASLEDLAQTIDDVFEATGRRVHVIGHSLGGLLARGAAMHRPQRVEQVVTLGSPVNGIKAHPVILVATSLLADCDGTCMPKLQQRVPARVRETNVFSRNDAIVDWRSCRRDDGACCVEVDSTHCGMAFNAGTYTAIAAALGAPRSQAAPRELARAQAAR